MSVFAAVLLSGCTGHDRAIEDMVNELNSPAFRAAQAKTGFFDDTVVSVEGQQIIMKFLCRPFINLASIDREEYTQLETATVNEFRAHLVDEQFKKGLEAMRAKDMTLLLDWRDVNGFSIKIMVDPAVILEPEP